MRNKGEKTSLKPLYSKLVMAQSITTGTSRSAVIAESVKKYFDSMPAQQRDSLLKINKKQE